MSRLWGHHALRCRVSTRRHAARENPERGLARLIIHAAFFDSDASSSATMSETSHGRSVMPAQTAGERPGRPQITAHYCIGSDSESSDARSSRLLSVAAILFNARQMPQSATAPRAVAASRNVWTVVIVIFSAARPARIASRESHRREGSIIAKDVSGERALRTLLIGRSANDGRKSSSRTGDQGDTSSVMGGRLPRQERGDDVDPVLEPERLESRESVVVATAKASFVSWPPRSA